MHVSIQFIEVNNEYLVTQGFDQLSEGKGRSESKDLERKLELMEEKVSEMKESCKGISDESVMCQEWEYYRQ